MKTVIVRYRTSAAFAPTNRANIEAVMEAHRAAAHPGVRYAAFTEGDGCSFVHIGMYADQAAQDAATSLPEFAAFQAALRASKPERRPEATWLNLVGAGYETLDG